ncbi:MAG: hypothetical protein PHO20_02675 [Candidatus Peribacteraceae bacterium]|nr:hypothetical protein [Candidatus Peribacteraceae bacterium]
MRIIVFTEGTILMHKNAVGHTRKEIILQANDMEPSIHEFASYLPIGRAAEKLSKWKSQGAKIVYLTSRRKPEEIHAVSNVLKTHRFPDGPLLSRKDGEEYKDVVERVTPDVLIEDDCESIGGVNEMTITHVKPETKQKISSIVIKEFGGIDYLPDQVALLAKQ